MARILLGSMPLDGHLAPLLPIARSLAARGHDVRIYTGRRYGSRVEAAGAKFEPMRAAPDPGDADPSAFFGLDGLPELDKLRRSIERVFTDSVHGQIADLRALYATWPADVVLTESTFMGPALMHELGIGPVWAAYNPLPVTLSSRDTAPFGLGIPPMAGPVGRVRNALLAAFVQRVVLRGPTRHIARTRRMLGLPRDDKLPFDMVLSPYLYVQGTVPSFEYPRSDLAPQVHFVGPSLPHASDFEPPAWWPDVVTADRPVIHVTQGTLATDDSALLVPTLQALADEPLLVVATTGRPLEALGIGSLPANARVATFLPYMQVLAHADVMVTNGGYGGVQMALANGVPLVVAGRTEDKPDVAARVAWSGVGLDLRTDRPTGDAIRTAVRTVLESDRYRTRAAAIAREIALTDAPETIADLVERLAASRAPILRDVVPGGEPHPDRPGRPVVGRPERQSPGLA